MIATVDYATAMISTGITTHRPDYAGGSIVNLMASVAHGRGAVADSHAPLALADEIDFAGARTILLLVIDGLGYDFLHNNFPDSTIARHVRARLTSVFPTTTAAAITTLLTGMTPAEHGLTGWHVRLEEPDDVVAVLPFHSRRGREPLSARGFEPATLLNARPIYPRLDCDCHVVSPSRIANSPFNTAFSRGARVHSFDTLQECAARIATIVAADQQRKYIYAYWSELDHLGHEAGIDSVAAREHFHEIDAAFAALVGGLRNSGTLVLLTADHGIVDTEPATHVHLRHHPALTAMLDVPLCGEPRAAYCYVHAGEYTAFENYVASELAREATAVPSRALLDAGLFGPGDAHPALDKRIGDYTLLMNENFAVSDTVGPERPSTLIGVHGGLSPAELFVPLAVAET